MIRRPLGVTLLALALAVTACSSGGSPAPHGARRSVTRPALTGDAVVPRAALSFPTRRSDVTVDEILPSAAAFDADGVLYASDCDHGYIFRIGDDGSVRIVAGDGTSDVNGAFAGDGGPATRATIDCPIGLAFDRDGDLYFADHANSRIRMIDQTGTITTVVGDGPIGTGLSGPLQGDGGDALDAWVRGPVSVAFDEDGNLYIGDRDDNAVRRVATDGTITTIAGTGDDGFSGDGGPSEEATFDDPEGVVVTSDGTVVIADSLNHRIRVIEPSGPIETYAGTGDAATSGDGGPAADAAMIVDWVSMDADRNLYGSEGDGHVVRVIRPDGTIERFAGTGDHGCSGVGGPAIDAELGGPNAVVFAPNGDVVIPDGECGLLTVDASGTLGRYAD